MIATDHIKPNQTVAAVNPAALFRVVVRYLVELNRVVALPETSIRRRLLVGVIAILVGAAAMAAGLFADVPRGGYVLGLGTLAVLLGVTAVSPVISRPFLRTAQAAYRRGFGAVGNLAGQNSLRNPRRTTATASALMIGLVIASA